MSLIFVPLPVDAYNAKSSNFGGSDEDKDSTQRQALQGVKAPHTGKSYSEALLLGVRGGIAFGYFTFEYKGYLAHVALLRRTTRLESRILFYLRRNSNVRVQASSAACESNSGRSFSKNQCAICG